MTGCHRRAYSMYKASLKVSPLDACPEHMSLATGLKFWYVGDTDPQSKLAKGIGHLRSWVGFMAAQTWAINLPLIVNYTNILLEIMSPFAVQSAPLCLYNLTWYHVTFLWHHCIETIETTYLSSPSSHLIESCWHTVNSCIFDKIYGLILRSHNSGPGWPVYSVGQCIQHIKISAQLHVI